jgi:cytoskeletal protein CcmA (bactofilin family)
MAVKSEWKDQPGAERVSIAGSGRISGGTYQSVKVAGSGTIDGDVKAETISVAGACTIHGSVIAEEMKASGSCTVEGDVTAEEFRTNGSAKVNGDVNADVFKCSGSQRVEGKLTTSYTKISGSCKVGGDVEADKFNSEGSFEIQGLLSADIISIRLGGDCSAREIGGEKIEIKRKSGKYDRKNFETKSKDKSESEDKKWQFDEFGIQIDVDLEKITDMIGQIGEDLGIHVSGYIGRGSLTAEVIEGDKIYLESTKAKIVRGKKIVIGPDCEIDSIEFEESLEIDEYSRVSNQTRI